MSIISLTDQNFKSEVLQNELPVLVDFYASWCGPCRMLAPIIEEIATEFDGKLKVAKLDVDSNQTTTQEYGILSIPTVIFFKNGQVVSQITGVQTKEKLEEEIKKIINI